MAQKYYAFIRSFLTGLVVLCMSAPGLASDFVQQSEAKQLRTVSVSGAGLVNAAPDMAVVRLGVQNQEITAEQTLAINSEKMAALLKELKKAHIPEVDIQTQAVSLQPRYERVKNVRRLLGYVATNVVEVKVRVLENLGEVLDAAIKAGGNTIEDLQFQISDPAELLKTAREAAMKDARHKAEQLASLAGARLGKVLTINESSHMPTPIIRQSMAMAEVQKTVPIQAGSQSISVNVQVVWLLAD